MGQRSQSAAAASANHAHFARRVPRPLRGRPVGKRSHVLNGERAHRTGEDGLVLFRATGPVNPISSDDFEVRWTCIFSVEVGICNAINEFLYFDSAIIYPSRELQIEHRT